MFPISGLFLSCGSLFLIILFIYIPNVAPSLLHLRECPPPPSLTPQSHHPGHQVSTRLGTSPNEASQGSPLLHMCRGPWTSLCMVFGWWLSLWELWGVWLVDIVVLPMGLQTPSAPSVLPLALPLGYWPPSNVWLWESASVWVSCW